MNLPQVFNHQTFCIRNIVQMISMYAPNKIFSLHFQKTRKNMNHIIKRFAILFGSYILITACTLKFLRMRRNPVTAILRASTCL